VALMADIIEWPICVLRPQQVSANLVPFTRSGGRTLGGIEPSTRTDLGYWSIDYGNIVIQNRYHGQWQTWTAIRQKLGGKSGLVAVRVRNSLSAPYVSGRFEPVVETPHDDDTLFDDDTPYVQGAISVVSDGVTAIGATTIKLRIIEADRNLAGVRFSYHHALYETGPIISIDGDVWTVPIWPSVRELIPAGSALEFDQPTCLCHLVDDRGMDITQDALSKGFLPSVSFVEATDYWASLAEL
jgi:hypothetical protein